MELDFLFRKRMIEAGRIQTYCIKELFTSINALSDKYIFEVFTTKSNSERLYDSIICLRDKMTEKVKEWYIIKAIILEEDKDTFLLTQSDYKKLRRAKWQLSNDSFSQIYRKFVIYFTTDKTVIFNIDELKYRDEKNWKPNKEKYKNGYRNCFKLNLKDGHKNSFIYNIDSHHKDLIIERDIIEDEILDLYKLKDEIKKRIEDKHIKSRKELPKI